MGGGGTGPCVPLCAPLALMEAPILAYPDISKAYKLYTDASNYAIGAALGQETAMGERAIQYLSHQLNGNSDVGLL